MKAKDGVIDLLNATLTIELTAINQYFLNAKMCSNWGFNRLADKFRSLSMDEMKDTDELLDRILYLEGMPNMQRLNQVSVGENVMEILQAGLRVEQEAVANLIVAIEHTSKVADFTTKTMFEEMIADEEVHVDWFETQLETIRLIGLDNYLTQQLHS